MIHKILPITAGEGREEAKLFTYFLDNSPEIDMHRTRPLIIICPGGGYEMTSDREAEGLAMQFLAAGFHAAVLRYSVSPARYPEALLQLAQTVVMLRRQAAQYHIDPERIIVQGSSAGGHLAASLGVFWNKEQQLTEVLKVSAEELRPNGLLLSYPVISSGEKWHRGSFEHLLGGELAGLRDKMSLERQVDADTPPAFLWHTAVDDAVPVENSLLFFQALHQAKVPAELHIYPVGGHGLALANQETCCSANGYGIQEECQSWIELAVNWVRHR